MAEDRKAAVIEKFGEGLLIILFEFVVLIKKFFFLFFVFEFQCGVLKNIEDDVFGLFFEENVADTEKTGEFLELAVDDPLDWWEVLLVAQVEHEDHFAETGRFVILFEHEVRVAGVEKEGD